MDNIIDLVCNSHGEISEHAGAARRLVEAARSQGTFADAGKVLAVLEELTVEHFRREEAMMGIIERDEKLAPGQQEYYAEVRQEHARMNGLFGELNGLRKKFDGGDAGAMKAFFDKVLELTGFIHAHAEREDRELFPFARQALGERQLRELRDAVKGS